MLRRLFEIVFHFNSAMDMYTEQFKSLKGSRTLEWKAHLGSVDLELEFEDRTLPFNVSPSRAAVIMYFQEKRMSSEKSCSILCAYVLTCLGLKYNNFHVCNCCYMKC